MAASVQEKFEAAVSVIQSLPKNASTVASFRKLPGSFQPSHDLMLKFYAWYKQATIGKCNISRPAFWDVIGKAKWNAWNGLGNMPKEKAMENYVDGLKNQFSIHYNEQIIEAMPHTDVVQGFIEKLGQFYEVVEEKPLHGLTNGNVQTGAGPLEDLALKSELETDTSAGSDSPSSDLGPSEHELEENIDHDEMEASAVVNSTPVKGPALTTELTTKLNGKGVNGWSHDESSDGEEFCDTSDTPENQSLAVYTAEALNGGNPDQLEYIPSMENSEQISVKVGKRKGADHNDNDFSSGDQWRSNGFHDQQGSMRVEGGEEDVTDALVSRGGGEPGGARGSQPVYHANSGGNVSNQGRVSGADIAQDGARGRSRFAASGGAGGGGHDRGGRSSSTGVSEQIAVALVRLQQDMNSVLTRLNTLETLTLAQHQINRSRDESNLSERGRENQVSGWWWPFPNVNKRTVFFILVWPFIVHWVITVLGRRKNRLRRP